jgi:hypothetical protein
MTDDEIARFQADLLEVLAETTDPAEVVARMQGHGALSDFLAAADPRMVRVAIDLVRRWAVAEDRAMG